MIERWTIVSDLIQYRYGKSSVWLIKVTHLPYRHELKEVKVNIQLEGAFERAYTDGDNRNVVPTDTMKNTVYALAKDDPVRTIESFGLVLADHFATNNPQVSSVTIELEESNWDHIATPTGPDGLSHHPHAFVGGGNETRTSIVVRSYSNIIVKSGVRNLLILKTSDSAFTGYAKDRFTTLKETDDRILATSAEIFWTYRSPEEKFDECYPRIRQTLLDTFANHKSASVQHTLYAMANAALQAHEEITEISLTMPNKHCLLVDLKPFGMENNNEIFISTSEPYGLILGTVKRKPLK